MQTARIVLKMATWPVRLTGLPYAGTTITARLQGGEDPRIARSPDPSATLDGLAPRSTGSGTSPTIETDDGKSQKPVMESAGKERATSPRAALTRRGRRLSVRPNRGQTSRGGLDVRDRSLLAESTGGALAGKLICIDAGHGGWKSGAQGQN